MKLKATTHIPCDTETASWDKLSDGALAQMEKKLNDEEKDKLIVEAMGECWHEFARNKTLNTHFFCIKCCIETNNYHLNKHLATPEGFFWIWPRLKKQPWYVAFREKERYTDDLIDPPSLRDRLFNWLEANPEKWHGKN